MRLEEILVGLPDFVIEEVSKEGGFVFGVRWQGKPSCPDCASHRLRIKDRFRRRIRHVTIGQEPSWLEVDAHKYWCQDCGRYFNTRFPGIGRWRRNSEPFRVQVFEDHKNGIDRKCLAGQERIGTATVERWFHELLERKMREMESRVCPRALGIDEHYFTRQDGFATTLCDLEHHRVFDVMLGRSEASLANKLNRLKGRERVQVVCMDMAESYRQIVRRFFPNAKIVSDRFHVVRLINDAFLRQWRQIDPEASRHRGLLSLMRRKPEALGEDQVLRLDRYLHHQKPVLGILWNVRNRLIELMNVKTQTRRNCREYAFTLLDLIDQLKRSGLALIESLGQTLERWSDEIARMWRFSKNNGITEGFHTKMELISRRAYGFRNFENYRLRVCVLCA